MPGPLSAQLIAAYETHADRMFRHCYLRLLSRDAAKQILEDTFVRAWSYLKSETGEGHRDLKTLLYRIANGYVESYREEHPDDELPASTLEDPKLPRVFLTTLRLLSSTERDLLVMHYVDCLEIQTIGQLTGLEGSATRKQLAHAEERLKSFQHSTHAR